MEEAAQRYGIIAKDDATLPVRRLARCDNGCTRVSFEGAQVTESRSNSSVRGVPVLQRIREWHQFLRLRISNQVKGYDFGPLFSNLTEYDARLRQHCGRGLEQSRVLEIGFGARPLRLVALTGRGVDAYGIDLDRPMISGGLTEAVRILRSNGWERALKSVVRHTLFDGGERRALARALRERGWQYRLDRDRFIIGDAAHVEHPRLTEGGFDLVFSEDVFEHLPPDTMERALGRIARWLKPGGIAVIRPLVFTGITGGHLVDWYAETFGRNGDRLAEPWEHLRKQRYVANTFLNKMRLADYRAQFRKRFDILEEKPVEFGLGREFLTDAVRRELADYEEAELLTNAVLFTLRARG